MLRGKSENTEEQGVLAPQCFLICPSVFFELDLSELKGAARVG